jgi:hypothetical protein
LRPGNLLRFSLRDESVKLVDGKIEIGELQFAGKLNRSRAFADSHSKVSAPMTMFRVLFSSHVPKLLFCVFRFCSSMLPDMLL